MSESLIHPPFVRPPIVSGLNLGDWEPGKVHRMRVVMTENATGNETLVPTVLVKAKNPEPVVGITAVVHGNELNGIQVIHRLLDTIVAADLVQGSLVLVPIVNVPGYLRKQREFEDGVDLNRIMPGKEGGDESEFYAHRFVERIAKNFQYLIDLHTASTGRINSLYVRADMRKPAVAQLARLFSPQIIVHSSGADGSLRSAAAGLGASAITIEVGDPQRLQGELITSTRVGIQAILKHLGLFAAAPHRDRRESVECARSYWIYSDRGGVLHVLPDLTDRVKKGEHIATLFNVWGDVVREYLAPEDGVVVGKSTDPSARAGSRILHLGVVGEVAK